MRSAAPSRQDPGFWWTVRWYAKQVRWAWVPFLLALLAYYVWASVRGWEWL